MSQAPQPPRGTQDWLAPESERFTALERSAAEIFELRAYRRIMTPMFEDTAIFRRGVGESTDIVNKEMYTFEDRSGHSLTLRPEGTAPVMRAIVSNHLWDEGLPIKVWYSAPMFRYERPQKGRMRQHNQLGIEAVGTEDPAVDAEVIEAGLRVFEAAGTGEVSLLLNSMGHPECRAEYMPSLVSFLREHAAELDEDCHRRTETNPLRVFDCKVPRDLEVLAAAPTLAASLCDECREHLDRVKEYLQDAGIAWTDAPRLVRGFDYYTRTTFEYQSRTLDSAQNAIGGGGRYDGLVAELGGPALPGIGFGLGVERILLAQEAAGGLPAEWRLECSVIAMEPAQKAAAVRLVRAIRDAGLSADSPHAYRKLKDHLSRAAAQGVAFVAIIGEREAATEQATLKDMGTGEQEMVPLTEIPKRLAERAAERAR